MTYEEKVRWLRRYQDSLRREQELAEEVEQLRSRACKVTPSLSGMPGGTSDGQALPLAVEQILEAQQELQAQIEQCNIVRKEVIDTIETVADKKGKEILRRMQRPVTFPTNCPTRRPLGFGLAAAAA